MPVVILVLLVTLAPLAIFPGLSFHYDTVPRIVLLSIGSAALLLFREVRAGIIGLWQQTNGRRLVLLTTAQTAWFALAAALSDSPWFSLLGNNWRRMGWMTILAVAVFTLCSAGIFARRKEAIRYALRGLTVALFVASLYGVCQYFDIDPLQNPAGYHAQTGDFVIVRPPGTMGHADYFGWWLAVAVFGALALFRMERGTWRAAALATTSIAAIALVLTGTRAAMLGALAGVVTLALTDRSIQWRRWLVIGASAIAVLAAFYLSPPGERLRARVHWVSEEPVGGARPLLWRDSLQLAAAHPLLGTGPETFAATFPLFQSVELSRLLPDFYHESPHNMALDALAEQGIPGVLLACAWLGLAYIAGRQAIGHHPAAPALLAAVAASATAGIFGVATAGPVFATLLAIAILISLNCEASEARDSLWLAAAAIPLFLFGASLFVSDFALATASRIPASELASAPRELPLRIPGAGEDLFWSRHLGSFCNQQPECLRIAIRAAARATGTSDNPALAWYNLAIFTSTMGDAAGVERSLRTAMRLAPNWFKPHWSLANLLLITGHGDEARREAERAVLLDAGKDDEVNVTLQRAKAQ